MAVLNWRLALTTFVVVLTLCLGAFDYVSVSVSPRYGSHKLCR